MVNDKTRNQNCIEHGEMNEAKKRNKTIDLRNKLHKLEEQIALDPKQWGGTERNCKEQSKVGNGSPLPS